MDARAQTPSLPPAGAPLLSRSQSRVISLHQPAAAASSSSSSSSSSPPSALSLRRNIESARERLRSNRVGVKNRVETGNRVENSRSTRFRGQPEVSYSPPCMSIDHRPTHGGDCPLHSENMSCCWRSRQLHARVRDDERHGPGRVFDAQKEQQKKRMPRTLITLNILTRK
jgi:hypothetical protein